MTEKITRWIFAVAAMMLATSALIYSLNTRYAYQGNAGDFVVFDRRNGVVHTMRDTDAIHVDLPRGTIEMKKIPGPPQPGATQSVAP
jgi:hypothetical protein